MDIDKNVVKNIGELARLELEEKDLDYFAPQLAKIIGYIDKINQLALDDVSPTFNVNAQTNVYREDKARKFDNIAGIIKNFPNKKDRFIKVDKVV